MGTDMGKEKKDAENAENREIEQELRRRLRSLDREIPVPDKASAEQLLYRLQAQNGRKSRIPSWVRTLSLGLACCFVAVFGLWGFFSGAFGALFGSKNLSTGEGSTLPVSYTHLDVYKRQPLSAPAAAPPPAWGQSAPSPGHRSL